MRKDGDEDSRWRFWPSMGSVVATTTAEGAPTATSCAKDGPLSVAKGLGTTEETTCDMRRKVPSSMPLEAETMIWSRVRMGAMWVMVWRRYCEGVTQRRISASKMAEGR